ncbi:MAG TPA: hypothetical protein VL053_13060 [Arachidicoccus sp.]|nr:hypothetical protein [Arachidicoccus sp.]
MKRYSNLDRSALVFTFLIFIISSFLFAGLEGCKKDTKLTVPSGAQPPTIALTAVPTKKAAGWYEVRIAGTIKDAAGLKTIRIKCDSFHLDQTIKVSMDSAVTSFILDRTVKAPLSLQNTSSTIEVTVTNRYDLASTLELKINDIEAPSFKTAISDYIIEIENNKALLNIDFTALDNKALQSVVVQIPELNIKDSSAVSGTSYEYKKTLELPLKKGSFPLTITLWDNSGLSVTKTASVRVSRTVPYVGDLDLYIAPAQTGGDFSKYISGMPGVIKRTGDYLYEAKYYAVKAGTEVYLLGQKSFTGYRFGQDPLGDPGDLTYDDKNSLPIRLPEKGYYVISLDTKTEKYTVKKETPPPSEAWSLPDNPLAMAGSYFDEYPAANRPKGAVECVPEAGNPFRYVTRVKMHKLVSFTLTPKDPVNDKWLSPFWRYDHTLDGKLIQGGSGKNNSYSFPNPTAVYWVIITFDLHLQTCTVENDGLAN